MEDKENINNLKGEEMLEDLFFNKSSFFLKKKSKALDKPFDCTHLVIGDSLKEFINIFTNDNKAAENNNNNLIDDKTNLTTIFEHNVEDKEEISKESNNNNIIELQQKSDLSCFALDLLEKNGEFQIKFSKKMNSTYLLKIKEVDIKDDYFSQIKYAKYHGKNSSLKFSAPSKKFWLQRYYYFSKFDHGIMMDKESWYSVTPEEIAKYTAKLIEGKSIIDGFCGCGGNVIQFSKYCSKVYAIDISKTKLDMCKNNCKVYHCKNNITFIHSDFLKMKNKIKADYIFLSPSWGGVEYKNSEVYSIKKYMKPDITEIIRVSLNVANNILFFLPRNLDLDELFDLCSTIKNEIEENSGEKLFFDIKIIKSNDRIKLLLITFGHNIKNYFSRNKLEKFLKYKYEKIDEKGIDELYSNIKKMGHFRFFEEEYTYRATRSKESKGSELCYFNEYIKNLCRENEFKTKSRYANLIKCN